MGEIVKYQERKAVDVRREMLRNEGVLNSLTTVERAIFIASTDKTIREFEGKELVKNLATALSWIAKDVGIRNDSDWGYNLVRISEVLVRYYSDFTLKDFSLAFELSLTGELNAYLPKGRDGQPVTSHFQVLNLEYVCRILNAYKSYRSTVIKKANDAVIREPERNFERERYYRDMTKKDVVKAFLSYKYRGKLPELSSIDEMLIYDVLAKNKYADDIIVSEHEAREIIKTNSKVKFFTSYRTARRKALKEALEKMIEDEIQITDYIKYDK